MTPADDLLIRFKKALPIAGRFVCVPCIATELRVDPNALTEAVVTPLWSGYTFANTACSQCGRTGYCATSIGAGV